MVNRPKIVVAVSKRIPAAMANKSHPAVVISGPAKAKIGGPATKINGPANKISGPDRVTAADISSPAAYVGTSRPNTIIWAIEGPLLWY